STISPGPASERTLGSTISLRSRPGELWGRRFLPGPRPEELWGRQVLRARVRKNFGVSKFSAPASGRTLESTISPRSRPGEFFASRVSRRVAGRPSRQPLVSVVAPGTLEGRALWAARVLDRADLAP